MLGRNQKKEFEDIKPNTDLELLIELENQFPERFPIKLRTVSQVEKLFKSSNKSLDSLFDYIYEYLKDSPLCLAYVNLQPPFYDGVISNQIDRYENLIRTIEKLRLIAANPFYRLEGPSEVRDLLSPIVYFNVENRRAVFISSDLYMKAIQGSLVERIRMCCICQKVIYAYRDKKWTCSKICSNRKRQREFRKNLSEEGRKKINEQRRRNYHYKNKLEDMKFFSKQIK